MGRKAGLAARLAAAAFALTATAAAAQQEGAAPAGATSTAPAGATPPAPAGAAGADAPAAGAEAAPGAADTAGAPAAGAEAPPSGGATTTGAAGAPADAAGAPADADAAQVAFNTHCRTCHSLEPGEHRLGPSLGHVVGRQAGSAEGYGYSSSMAQAGFAWDAERLAAFIENPDALVPGHAMRPYPGVADPADVAAIIAALEAASE